MSKSNADPDPGQILGFHKKLNTFTFLVKGYKRNVPVTVRKFGIRFISSFYQFRCCQNRESQRNADPDLVKH
jgi:hypothetical protein